MDSSFYIAFPFSFVPFRSAVEISFVNLTSVEINVRQLRGPLKSTSVNLTSVESVSVAGCQINGRQVDGRQVNGRCEIPARSGTEWNKTEYREDRQLLQVEYIADNTGCLCVYVCFQF